MCRWLFSGCLMVNAAPGRGGLHRLLALGTPLFLACGAETGPGGTDFALDASRAVSATIGREGGTLQTTDARGRSYILDIPPLALAESVPITLTPVASFPELPGGGTVLAAAHFGPEGLAFARPALLRISGGSFAGHAGAFTYAGTGQAVQPAIAGGTADELVALVNHFSGIGFLAEILELEPDGPTPGEVQAFIEVNSIAIATDWPAGNWESAYDGIVQGLESWYRDHVGPALTDAATDQELTNALSGYSAWRHVIDCGGSTCPSESGNLHLWPDNIGVLIKQALDATLETAASAVTAAVERGVLRTIERCRAERDLAAGARSIYWTKVAILLGAEHPDDPLGECVTLELHDFDFPDPVAAGTPAALRLVTGLSFGGESPTYEHSLNVQIEASDALPSVAGGNTVLGTGEFTMDFTPDGDAPVVLGIRVNWIQNGLQDHLKLDTLIERPLGVTVSLTPAAAILDPGAEAQFTATVIGTTNTAVTWSATGGTVSIAGNTLTYLAGGTPGTYAVTAASDADPSRSSTAIVEIVGDAPPETAVTVTLAAVSGRLATASEADATFCSKDLPSVSMQPTQPPESCTMTGALARTSWATVSSSPGSTGAIDISTRGEIDVSVNGGLTGQRWAATASHGVVYRIVVRQGNARLHLSGSMGAEGYQNEFWPIYSRTELVTAQENSLLVRIAGQGPYAPPAGPSGPLDLTLNETVVVGPGEYFWRVSAYGGSGSPPLTRFPSDARAGGARFDLQLVATPE